MVRGEALQLNGELDQGDRGVIINSLVTRYCLAFIMRSFSLRLTIALAASALGLALTLGWYFDPGNLVGRKLAAAVTTSIAGEELAPEFPPQLDWINLGRGKLRLADLKGKVVVLDFWTYGCINCIHVIPDLKRLEAKYPEELVVIGVHSAKFKNEAETENIRRFIMRYDVRHPVINDYDFEVWHSYGARAWPTLAVIDPAGGLVGTVAGEGHYDLLDNIISKLIVEFEERDELDRTPLKLAPERDKMGHTKLAFPGKVLADGGSERLFIADSSQHRIVITDFDGKVLDVIGTGSQGYADGSYEEAQFALPQGMALAGADTLYVADTETHTIRRIDLKTRTVSTAAGIGRQMYQFNAGGPARSTGLNSPWDVLYLGGRLYIAMAGQHQLWVLDIETDRVEEFAGSRREELKDGPRLQGGLNQPSGLTTDGDKLYVADSEASAIRTVSLGEDGRLETIVGTGLFDFGDVDGVGNEIRLQHPLGVAYYEGEIMIADTYNTKIKRLNPETREAVSWLGGDGLFYEPGGLSIAGDRLFIADTNHHRIKVASLKTGEVRVLELRDPEELL